MFDHYLTFRSLTRAQSAQRALRGARIPCELGRAPEIAGARGCGYALRLRAEDLRRAADVLHSRGLDFVRLFRRQGSRLEELTL